MDGAAHGQERPVERAAVEGDEAVELRERDPEVREHFLLGAPDVLEEAVVGRPGGRLRRASYQTMPLPVSGFSIAITTIFPV